MPRKRKTSGGKANGTDAGNQTEEMNGEPTAPLEGQPYGAEVVKRKRGRPPKQPADEPPPKRGRPAGAPKNGAVQPPQWKRARPPQTTEPQPTRVQPFRRRSSLLAAAKRDGHELQADGEPAAVDEQAAGAQGGAAIDGVESAANDGVPREQIVLPPPPSPPQPPADHRIGIRINGHVPPAGAPAPHQPHGHSTTNVNGVEVVTLSSSSPISAGSSSITIPPPLAHKTPPLITASDTTHSSKTAPLLADAALEPEDTQDASESSSLHQLPLNEEPSTSNGRPRRVKTPLPSAVQPAGGSGEEEVNGNQTEGTVRLCIPAHTVDSMNARRLNCDKWELKVDFPEASADFTRTKQLLELMASDCAHKRPPDVHQFAPNDFRRLSAQIDFVADLWKRMTAVCDLNENLRLKQLEIKAVVEAVPTVDGDESDADSMGVRFDDDEAEEFSLEAEIEQIDKQKRIRRSTRTRAPQDEVRFLETDGDDSADEATNAVPPPSDEKFRHEQFLSTGVRNDCLIGIKLTPPHSTSNYRMTAAEQRRSEGMRAGLVNQHVSNDPWNPKASVDWWAVRLINNYDETQQRFYD